MADDPIPASPSDSEDATDFSFLASQGEFAKIERRSKDGDPWESVGRLSPPADEETIRETWGGGIYRVSIFGKQANGRACRRAHYLLRLAGPPRNGSAPPAQAGSASLDSELARLGQLAAVVKSILPSPPPTAPVSDAILTLLINQLFREKREGSNDPLQVVRSVKEAARELGLSGGGEEEPSWPAIVDKVAPQALEVVSGLVEAWKGHGGAKPTPRPLPPGPPRKIPAAAPTPPPSPAPAVPQEENDMGLYMMVLNMVVGRMIRGYKAGEDPEEVAEILAGMFPDLLDQVESIPEDQVVTFARQHADKAQGGRELLADAKAEEFLRAVYRALVRIAREPEDPPGPSN